MIESIAAIGQSAHLSASTPHGPPATIEGASLQQPTHAEAASFARALASSAPMETTAAAPAGGESLSARLAAQADHLSAHLQALGPASAESATRSAPTGHALTEARSQMGDAVAQIERAYMFAIETTMASRGSTETTKIFNTLLKGQ